MDRKEEEFFSRTGKIDVSSKTDLIKKDEPEPEEGKKGELINPLKPSDTKPTRDRVILLVSLGLNLVLLILVVVAFAGSGGGEDTTDQIA